MYALIKNRFLIILLLVTGCLLFLNLDNIYLWQDEAETALVAKNLLKKGYPNAWDGRNLITQNAGLDSNEDYVWIWSPWLQYYATAAAFVLLGESVFSARLPFVLIGLGSVILFYFFSRKLARNETAARFASILFVTSIPFLLHVRQARWYALAIFCSIWVLYAYIKLQEKEKTAVFQFVLSSFLLFHSSLLTFLATVGGLFFYYLYCLFLKHERPLAKSLISSLVIIVLLVLPWVIFTEGWNKSNAFEAYTLPFFERVAHMLKKNIINFNGYFFPLVLMPGLIWALKRDGLQQEMVRRNFYLLCFIVVSTLLVLAVLPWSYFRYMIGLAPVCALLLGIILWRLWINTRIVAVTVVLLLVFTNVFSMTLAPRNIKFDFFNYLYEITHDYDGPNEGVVRYLKEHANENQFLITNYGELPIIFYTNMRAIGFGQDLRVPEQADWIIVRSGRANQGFLQYLARDYQAVFIDYPDIIWGNRPDPFYHKYRTVKDAPRILIYKKL